MSMLLYEEYVKNTKKDCKCAHGGAYRPPGDTQLMLSLDGLKMAQDVLKMVMMAPRWSGWPKMTLDGSEVA